MIVKTYGLFDKVAQNIVRTFTARNDDDAIRAGRYIVREKDFDPIAGCDWLIYHLFDFDSDNGLIKDNNVKELIDLKDAYEQFKAEEKGKEN